MADICVKVLAWDDHNKRPDIIEPRWFALSNRVTEDPKLFELSAEEFKAWIYILCQASQNNNDTVELVFAHAASTARVSALAMRSAIEKLIAKRIVRQAKRKPKKKAARVRGCSPRGHHRREEGITGQDKTGEVEEAPTSAGGHKPPGEEFEIVAELAGDPDREYVLAQIPFNNQARWFKKYTAASLKETIDAGVEHYLAKNKTEDPATVPAWNEKIPAWIKREKKTLIQRSRP